MLDSSFPSSANSYHLAHVELLLASYQRLLRKPLVGITNAETLGQQLYEADFVLLSHDTASDPVFNYGNRAAQSLFELSWGELVTMPSRLSAESVNQEERQRLLTLVTRQGYIDHYAGIRIAKSGRRFRIDNAVVWNVLDQQGRPYGQAACFKDWTFLS